MELSLNLDFNKIGIRKNLVMDAFLYITENVMPLFYRVDALVDSEEQTIECTMDSGRSLSWKNVKSCIQFSKHKPVEDFVKYHNTCVTL